MSGSPARISWRYALIIPALNEAESIKQALMQIPRLRFEDVLVVDNGSQDSTAQRAEDAGARVIHEPRRGYGRACQAGIRALSPGPNAIVFMDADLSDDPADLSRLLDFFEAGAWDLVIGSRVLGCAEPGSLTPLQRFGNWLTTKLIQHLWGVRFTDLGPLRAARREALGRMALRDPDFGWNVEMQAKAAMLGMRVAEIPVNYRPRRFGKSKISGTLKGSLRAGIKIIYTIGRCWASGQ
ncbi:MAG TPA: glycosyltransferase family 2 protein [Terriglobia bacterium]|nr:glycosyltransferase family 2 protein [Terriglobia bacterium]